MTESLKQILEMSKEEFLEYIDGYNLRDIVDSYEEANMLMEHFGLTEEDL